MFSRLGKKAAECSVQRAAHVSDIWCKAVHA